MTADNVEGLVGEGLNYVVFDEAAKAKRASFEKSLAPALMDKDGDALFITTPEGYNWIYDLYSEGRIKRNVEDGLIESFRVTSYDNPAVPREWLDLNKRLMSPELFDQEIMAQFHAMMGRVYGEFDLDTHLGDPQLTLGTPIDRAIDFGYNNPFVCLYIQRMGADVDFVCEEYRVRAKTMEEIGAELRKRQKELESQGHAFGMTYCDPSGASERASLRNAGISTYAPSVAVSKGLEEVRSQLSIRPDGSSGLIVNATKCEEFSREMLNYKYQEEKEEPVKDEDHGPDAYRYYVTGKSRRPKSRDSSISFTGKRGVQVGA